MKLRMLMLIMVVILAACGGGGDGDTAQPTPTPQPTLTLSERAQFTPGTQQNPLRMTVHPTDAVRDRVETVVAVAAGVRFDAVSAAVSLRDDLGLPDDLSTLSEPLTRDFNVNLGDPTAIETVADLVSAVQLALAAQASDAIFEVTRLYVEVIPVEIPGEGLSGVCDTGGGVVTIPWLDGVTYAASQALSCGDAGLLVAIAESSPDLFTAIDYVEPEPVIEATPEITPEVTAEATADAEENTDATETPTATPEPTSTPEPTEEPEPTPEVTPEATPESTPESTPEAAVESISGDLLTGEAGLIIISRTLGSSSLAVLPGRTFCRVGLDDFYGWLVPSLIFERDNIVLEDVVDVADTAALVAAVAAGDCAGAGLSAREFAELEAAGLTDDVLVAETTTPIPLGVLVYPVEVALGERVNFNETLPEFANDLEASRPLRLLLGQDALIPADENSFVAFNAFMAGTGFDLAGWAE